jgi:hypothetical protein
MMINRALVTALLVLSTSTALSPSAVFAESAVQALRTATQSFVASLDAEQSKTSRFSLDQDERATWSNLPLLLQPAVGVLVKDLNDTQRVLLHHMLRASLSSQGYGKAAGIMRLDDVLREQEMQRLVDNPELKENPLVVAMADDRSSGHYAVAVFGDPKANSWGWKMTGHHLAINITVTGEKVGYVPVFVGSNPMMVKAGQYAGWAALPAEGRVGIALMETLTPEQVKVAVLAAEVPQDIFEGPGRRASLKKFEGLSAKSLSAEQLVLLQRLVGEYVKNANADSAADHLDAIAAAGWDALWFSWRGPVQSDGKFYYRVHGPRLLIEYNRQDENHDHAVLRDPVNDYGEDWLGHHYQELHPTFEQTMQDIRERFDIDP